MTGAVEALHIFDEQKYFLNLLSSTIANLRSKPILSQIYTGRPLSATYLLPLYLAHPVPRPSFIYLPNTSPPTLLFGVNHANLLFLLTTSSEIEPLLALEFLHRVIDIFEEFLGSPLLSSKIESNYDVVAQLLNEMCDAGAVSTTEGNALRDLVEVEGWVGKLLGGINIPGLVNSLKLCILIDLTSAESLVSHPISQGHLRLQCQEYHPLAHQPRQHLQFLGGGQMFDTPQTSYT